MCEWPRAQSYINMALYPISSLDARSLNNTNSMDVVGGGPLVLLCNLYLNIVLYLVNYYFTKKLDKHMRLHTLSNAFN